MKNNVIRNMNNKYPQCLHLVELLSSKNEQGNHNQRLKVLCFCYFLGYLQTRHPHLSSVFFSISFLPPKSLLYLFFFPLFFFLP